MDKMIAPVFIFFCGLLYVFYKITPRLFQKKSPSIEHGTSQNAYFLGHYSPILSWAKSLPDTLPTNFQRLLDSTAVEILIIVCWGLFVGKQYLNLNPRILPNGMEYGMAIQNNIIWTNFVKCGTCFLWNGNVRGGAPAFADMYGSAAHPIAALSTIFFGLINGSKIMVVSSLILAGLAQWWLARVMNLGKLPRLWIGLLAVCGGQITTRMEVGTVSILLSTAACCLVIPPALGLAYTGKRKYTAWLGLLLGMALLSGQGYMQVGLVLCIILPICVFILSNDTPQKTRLIKQFFIAGILGFFIAGVFLIPMAHAYPHLHKFVDETISSAQAAKFIPLNLVIDLREFFYNEELLKKPFPYTTGNFIGWVPVVLAMISIKYLKRKDLPTILFFISSIILVIFASSGDLFKIIGVMFPVAYGVRNPQVICGFLGYLVMGLAAFGLDNLLKSKFPVLQLSWGSLSTEFPTFSISVGYLFIIPFLLININTVNKYNQTWLGVHQSDEIIYSDLEYLKTYSSEWVNPPYGIHEWIAGALEAGYKLGNAARPWDWNDEPAPPTFKEITFDPAVRDLPIFAGTTRTGLLIHNPEG